MYNFIQELDYDGWPSSESRHHFVALRDVCSVVDDIYSEENPYLLYFFLDEIIKDYSGDIKSLESFLDILPNLFNVVALETTQRQLWKLGNLARDPNIAKELIYQSEMSDAKLELARAAACHIFSEVKDNIKDNIIIDDSIYKTFRLAITLNMQDTEVTTNWKNKTKDLMQVLTNFQRDPITEFDSTLNFINEINTEEIWFIDTKDDSLKKFITTTLSYIRNMYKPNMDNLNIVESELTEMFKNLADREERKRKNNAPDIGNNPVAVENNPIDTHLKLAWKNTLITFVLMACTSKALGYHLMPSTILTTSAISIVAGLITIENYKKVKTDVFKKLFYTKEEMNLA